MAAKSAEAKTPPAEPQYPNIETLIEQARPDEVNVFFENVQNQLAALKGQKVEAGKKAKAGVNNAQELLGYLLQVRDRLAVERGKK